MSFVVTIPICFEDDITELIQQADVEIKLSQYPTRPITFFGSFAISEYRQGEEVGTRVFHGGDKFVSPLSPAEVLNKVQRF